VESRYQTTIRKEIIKQKERGSKQADKEKKNGNKGNWKCVLPNRDVAHGFLPSDLDDKYSVQRTNVQTVQIGLVIIRIHIKIVIAATAWRVLGLRRVASCVYIE
jgi:hypothetical protein